jgi:hypothetical protein
MRAMHMQQSFGFVRRRQRSMRVHASHERRQLREVSRGLLRQPDTAQHGRIQRPADASNRVRVVQHVQEMSMPK